MPNSDVSRDPGRWFDPDLAAHASRLFLLEQKGKSEIAELLGISRFKVARLLDEARARGIVRIEILAPEGTLEALSTELAARFNLSAALIVPTGPTYAHTAREIGATAARFALDHLEPGAKLGLGWGSTVGAAVPYLVDKTPIDVVQLAGGFAGVDPDFNGPQVVMDAAAQLGGRAYLLHAPSVAQTAAARSVLRDEPAIRQTVELYDHLSALITGIGALLPVATSAIYRGSVLGAAIQQQLADSLAIGDTCCHFVDARGHLIESFEDRIVGISASQIRGTPLRISAAFGTAKVPAIRAALMSGLPNVLVIDSTTATLLLQD